jgi:methyltransferase of ATP-grasp peptide maturase system
MTVPDWQRLASVLVANLEANGDLSEPAWRAAFTAIPRHLFVPCFIEQVNGAERVVDGADPAQRDHWLEQVYTDTDLVTQIKPSDADGSGGRRPTSSSSMPSIMAWMLEALELKDGQRILEIGTGTGYNAALLCHRLGDANVASIDIDRALVEQARRCLASLGYAPTLASGDGATGLPATAPYDAILATAAVNHIPSAWIEQLRTGGMIVADLRGGFSGAMIRLRKIDDDTVQGRCQSYDAALMPLRRDLNYPLRQGASSPLVMDRRNPQRGTTRTDPRLIVDSRVLRLLVELQLAGTHFDLFVGGDEVVITATDGSWAAATLAADGDGAHTVTQAGPRRLWDSVEAAVTTWHHAGKPDIAAFGVTASTNRDDQRVWLGDPRSSYSWPLPL